MAPKSTAIVPPQVTAVVKEMKPEAGESFDSSSSSSSFFQVHLIRLRRCHLPPRRVHHQNTDDDISEDAESLEDNLLCVLTGSLITLGSHSVLKVDDQNVIHFHRLFQKVVPLVKSEVEFPAYEPEYKYLSFLGFASELKMNEEDYDLDTSQQVLVEFDPIKASD